MTDCPSPNLSPQSLPLQRRCWRPVCQLCARLRIHSVGEPASCTISTKTFRVSAGLLTSLTITSTTTKTVPCRYSTGISATFANCRQVHVSPAINVRGMVLNLRVSAASFFSSCKRSSSKPGKAAQSYKTLAFGVHDSIRSGYVTQHIRAPWLTGDSLIDLFAPMIEAGPARIWARESASFRLSCCARRGAEWPTYCLLKTQDH